VKDYLAQSLAQTEPLLDGANSVNQHLRAERLNLVLEANLAAGSFYRRPLEANFAHA
jgi:hypothetical protein